MFRRSPASCLSEKHVYRGCQSTDDEPEASEGEASHKRQTVVSNVTQYLLKRKLIVQGETPNKTLYIVNEIRNLRNLSTDRNE